jgi:hypothetical protein
MKSPQAKMNANRPTVISEFRLIGSTIETKARSRPAPSTRAASTSEGGIPSMKDRMIKMPNGTAWAEFAMIRPGIESSRPRLSYTL